MKRARKAIKHLKTIVGRVVRDVERKIGSSENLAEIADTKVMASSLIRFEITLKSSSLDKEEDSQNHSKSSSKEDLQLSQ